MAPSTNAFGQQLAGAVSQKVIQDRLEGCKRRDYSEHCQLRALQTGSDNSSSESEIGNDSESSDDDDDDDNDGDEYSSFPITHDFFIQTGEKRVTSLAVSKAGTDFLVGSAESTLKYFSYNQLQLNKCEPFATLYPFTEEVTISEFGSTKEAGNYSINKIANDKQNDNFLVIPNSQIFKVFNNKGEQLWTSTKGDRYIQDYGLTKGHVNDIKDGIINGQEILTCSKDATLRKWDLIKEKQDSVTFFRDLRRERGSIDKIAECGNTLSQLVTADSRGKLSILDKRNISKAVAHVNCGSEILSLGVNEFNRGQIFTRTMNDEIQIYDLRKLQTPVLSRSDFFHTNEYQNLQISNNGAYLIGSTTTDNNPCQLHLMDLLDLSSKYILNLAKEATCLHWSYDINQILIGDVSGTVTTLFGNEGVSSKGIKLMFSKPAGKRRSADEDDGDYNSGVIYNAEDMANRNREIQQKKKKKRDQETQNDDITVFAKKDVEVNDQLYQDPREELLKHA